MTSYFAFTTIRSCGPASVVMDPVLLQGQALLPDPEEVRSLGKDDEQHIPHLPATVASGAETRAPTADD